MACSFTANLEDRSLAVANHRDLAFLSWVICAFLLIPALVVNERITTRQPDFVYLYSLARISIEHPQQLYDAQFQERTFQKIQPLKSDSGFIYGPSPYPPFVPLLFRPLTRLPFLTALHIWQLCSLALFLSGLALLIRRFLPKRHPVQSLVFAVTLSFSPFLTDTLLNGQVASIGFFFFCLALCEHDKNHPFRAGLALSLCAYKPTLLLLVVPMLLVRKQWRILSGLATGGAIVVTATTAAMGIQVWAAYWHMLAHLGQARGTLDFPMYVDAIAFWTMLFRNHPWVRDATLIASFAIAAGFLIRLWLRAASDRLVWAATLTWMLFLNVYVPFYDTILVIPGIILCAPTLLASSRRMFIAAMLLIWTSSWVAQPVARHSGLQVLTFALVFLGILQLWRGHSCLLSRQLCRDLAWENLA